MAVLDPKMDVFLRRQIQAMGAEYASLGKEVKAALSTVFEKYADNEGKLNYSELSKYGRLDKFREEVSSTVSKHQTLIDNKIRKTSSDVYQASYAGEMAALQAGHVDLKFKEVPPVEQVKKAVQNDLSGLTLNERLRGQRAGIIREINSVLTQGIHKGDSYRDMARQLTSTLEGNYVKATRIVRTEGHRVQEQGRFDVLHKIGTEKPKYKTMKWWDEAGDDRVRDSHAHMGVIYSKENAIPFDEDFVNPMTGGQGPYPGAMGTAEDDINCRCKMRTFIVAPDEGSVEEDTSTGTINNVSNYNTEEPPAAWNPQELVAAHKAQYGDVTFDSLAKKGSLDKNTANAFRYYKRHGYTDINRALRGKSSASKSTSARIETMDKWFSQKAVTVKPEGDHVWRGVSPRVADELVTVGRVKDPGFSSTSYQPQSASAFASKKEVGPDGVLNLMRVHVPGGEPIMTWENESELLLGRGKTFELLAIENIPPGQARSMGLFGRGARVLHCILK